MMRTPKNIYIIGAQSTGKTTLLRALQRHYTTLENRVPGITEPAVIVEVARKVLSETQINRDDIANTPAKCLELQDAILSAQYSAESAFAKGTWYISDRSGVDPIIYARLYAGRKAANELLESLCWKVLEENMKHGVVVLCESGCSWLLDDGIRLMPKDADEWTRTHEAFQELLSERGIEYAVVPRDLKDIGERVELVVRALRE